MRENKNILKQKLREFVTSKPTLKSMAKGSFLNKKEMIFFKKRGTLERIKEHWDVENVNKK